MNADYLAGLATIPAALGVVVLLLLLLRVLLLGTTRFGTTTKPAQRAAAAAVLFGARRARTFSAGCGAVVFAWGVDPEERRRAHELLAPPRRSLAQILSGEES